MCCAALFHPPDHHSLLPLRPGVVRQLQRQRVQQQLLRHQRAELVSPTARQQAPPLSETAPQWHRAGATLPADGGYTHLFEHSIEWPSSLSTVLAYNGIGRPTQHARDASDSLYPFFADIYLCTPHCSVRLFFTAYRIVFESQLYDAYYQLTNDQHSSA